MKLGLGLGSHLKPDTRHGHGRGRRRSRSPSIRTPQRSRSPTPIGRATSPHDPHHVADAVLDLVDEVHFATSRRGRARGLLRIFLFHLI